MTRDLLSEILTRKSNIKRPGLQVTLSRIKKRLDLRSIEQAACYYIKQNSLNINVSSIIDDVTRKVVQDNLYKQSDSINQFSKNKKFQSPKPIDKIPDPFIENQVFGAAYNNASIYPIIYLFENSVRIFVVSVMKKNFGNNWWVDKVNPKIQENVEIRRQAEKEAPWHSKRGADYIYYTDIDDLKKIINKYSNEFRKVLKNKYGHVIVWIDEIEKTRNILAHNNPVANKDKDRLIVFARDWSEYAKSVYERLNESSS